MHYGIHISQFIGPLEPALVQYWPKIGYFAQRSLPCNIFPVLSSSPPNDPCRLSRHWPWVPSNLVCWTRSGPVNSLKWQGLQPLKSHALGIMVRAAKVQWRVNHYVILSRHRSLRLQIPIEFPISIVHIYRPQEAGSHAFFSFKCP